MANVARHSGNQVLAEFDVIPLNSPAYYPPYNGSIENGIRERKTAVLEALPTST